MQFTKRFFLFLLCFILCTGFAFGEEVALETAPAQADAQPTEAVVESFDAEAGSVDDNAVVAEADAANVTASIEGLTPLYQTQIKPFTASGQTIRMRATQDTEGEVVCMIKKGAWVTIYAVYPSFVLAEYEGNVGFLIRTWISEYVTVIDPETTPPYGVVFPQYVATATKAAEIYDQPSTDGAVNPIILGEGSKVAVLEFVDGFAKVLYWRSYGYIDAALLTDLIVVSTTDDPMSEDTPIAAFNSFFAYDTGAEGNDGRCKNIVRTCELMTRVLEPGESLDFNGQVGPYSYANGYFAAPVLVNGGSQLGPGGGTCQSSSTLYNTIRQLPGITVTKRRPHGPGCARYLPMHQDAAVGTTTLNLIFRNDNAYPIRILAECTGEGSLCIQIFRVQ